MILTDSEWALLEKVCAAVPPPAVHPAVGTDADYPDYITNLLLTVLDLRLLNVIVNSATGGVEMACPQYVSPAEQR